jgi:hypothetical protein
LALRERQSLQPRGTPRGIVREPAGRNLSRADRYANNPDRNPYYDSLESLRIAHRRTFNSEPTLSYIGEEN